MKKILLVLLCLISLNASSQTTYLVDTAFTTDVGYGGAPASCVFTGGYYTGFWMDAIHSFSLADAFVVPFASTWMFDTVILYGFQSNSGTTSPFTGAYLEIYQGVPGAGGTVVWGDMTTNLLVSTGFTGIYRVDTVGGLTNTAHPIMYLKLHLPHAPMLSANTYWLHWSADASGSARINCPPKVLPGRINPSGQQGRQDSVGTWYTLSYLSNHSGFNKIIKASAAIAGVGNVNKTLSAVLGQNIPNPFNTATTISFYIPDDGYAKLSVYNTIGQLVATLINGDTNAGEHQVTFNADNLPTGIYYCQLSTSAGVESKQMLLVR